MESLDAMNIFSVIYGDKSRIDATAACTRYNFCAKNESGNKDSPIAIKASSRVAIAMLTEGKYKEARLW